MEATIRNLTDAAKNVHDSLTFTDLLDISMGTTKREAKTARSGFMDIICSISIPNYPN
jgi:hypothetical protein